jgi:type IV secretion system protein VirD4
MFDWFRRDRETSGVPLGFEWDMQRGRYGKRVMFDGKTAPHLMVIGPNGSGKGTRLLIPALLEITGRSIVVIDPKGELAAVTAEWRRTVSDVVVLNPFGLHVGRYPDLTSSGFNPLASLDETARTFYDDAKGLAEALITVEGDMQRHFPESARGLITAAIMWERKRHGDNASLKQVRMMLTERERWDERNGQRVLTAGLRRTAEIMTDVARQFPDQGGWQIASLASRFVEEFNNETRGVQSTIDTQTGWILSEPLAGDLERNGIDFRSLKQKPSTVYVILPGERLREHSTWLRLVIAWALRGLYSPGGVPVLFMMDEFAQLGRLGPIEDALGQGRGYGIALLPVLQDINQLRDLYKARAETFAGMSGAVFGFPPNDMNTAEWMSKRSGEEIVVGMSAGEPQDGDGGPRVNYHPERRPRYAPHELFNLPVGHALVWAPGAAAPLPVYAPPYWDIARCRERARPNPYHS